MSSKKFESIGSKDASEQHEEINDIQRDILADQIIAVIDKIPVHSVDRHLTEAEQERAAYFSELAEAGDLEKLYDELERVRENEHALDATTLDRLQEAVRTTVSNGVSAAMHAGLSAEQPNEDKTSEGDIDDQLKQVFAEQDRRAAENTKAKTDEDVPSAENSIEVNGREGDTPEQLTEDEKLDAEKDRERAAVSAAKNAVSNLSSRIKKTKNEFDTRFPEAAADEAVRAEFMTKLDDLIDPLVQDHKNLLHLVAERKWLTTEQKEYLEFLSKDIPKIEEKYNAILNELGAAESVVETDEDSPSAANSVEADGQEGGALEQLREPKKLIELQATEKEEEYTAIAELDRRLDLFKTGDVKAVKTSGGSFMPIKEIKALVATMLERAGSDLQTHTDSLYPYTQKIQELVNKKATTPNLSGAEKGKLQKQINDTHEMMVREVGHILAEQEKGLASPEVDAEANQEELKQRIAEASNYTELIDILWECKKPGKGIHDGEEYYDGATLINSVSSVRDGEQSITSITSACGLRKKVEELQQEYEKIQNKKYLAGSFTPEKANNFIKKNHQGMEVKVERSSGDIEDGWHATEIKDGYATVIKPNEDGRLIKKNVSVEDLQKINVPEPTPEWQAWNEARKEHLEATAAYEQSLVDFYKGFETQKFGKDKMKYLAKKAFGIKPELTSEMQQQREAMLEKTAVYNQAAQEQRAAHLANMETGAITPEEKEKQQKALERYQRMYARTVVTNSFQKQLHAQETAIAELPVNERYEKVKKFMQKNRNVIRYTAAGAIGGATGGLAGGAYLAARTGLSALAGAGAARLVMPYADERVAKAEQAADVEYEQTVASIEKTLQRKEPPLRASELQEMQDVLFELYDQVDAEKRRRIMTLVAASAAAGLVVGFGARVADLMSDGAGSTVSETPPPERAEVPFTPESEPVDVSPELDQDPGPVEVSPEPDPTDVPATVESTEDPAVVEASEESLVQPETVTHEISRGDTVWNLMETYSDRLDGLTEAEKNRVLMQLRAEINSSEALQQAAGIRSGQADLIYTGETLRINPLLEALDEKIDAIHPPETVVQAEVDVDGGSSVNEVESESAPEQAPAKTETDVSVIETEPESVVETVAAEQVASATVGQDNSQTIETQAESAPSTTNTPGVENLQAVDAGVSEEDMIMFADTEAYEARKAEWVEDIQGPEKESGFLSKLLGSDETVSNPFAALQDVTIKEIDEMVEAGTGAEQLQMDPDAFATWTQKLKEWRADSRIEGVSPETTFNEIADKAFYQQAVERDLARYAK